MNSRPADGHDANGVERKEGGAHGNSTGQLSWGEGEECGAWIQKVNLWTDQLKRLGGDSLKYPRPASLHWVIVDWPRIVVAMDFWRKC